MTQLLTLLGLSTSIIKNWVTILKEGKNAGSPLFFSRAKKRIKKGDEYDTAGLYDKALDLYNQALSINHRNVRAYLRKINVLVKLLRFKEASDLLAKADRYAKQPKDWFWVSNLHFVIQMEDFRQNPSQQLLESAQKHLEDAELEHDNLILWGRFVTSSLEGLWLLPNPETELTQKLEKTAVHYLKRLQEAKGSNDKYFDLFSWEIEAYLKRMDLEKLNQPCFWKNYLEQKSIDNAPATQTILK